MAEFSTDEQGHPIYRGPLSMCLYCHTMFISEEFLNKHLKKCFHKALLSIFKFKLSQLNRINTANEINDIDKLLDNPTEFNRIIPIGGTRLLLRNKFSDYFRDNTIPLNIGRTSTPILNLSNRPSIIQTDLNESGPRLDFDTPLSPQEEFNRDIDNYKKDLQTKNKQNDTLSIICEPPIKKAKFSTNYEINLKEILEKTPIGRAILSIYEYKQELSTQCQGYLCDIIVTHYFDRKILILENKDFEYLANKIHQLFENEAVSTYYVRPIPKKFSRNNKSENSKGKLVDKYKNKRTFIREAENLKKKNLETLSANVVNQEICDAERCRNWLIHNRAPPAKVEENWALSYCLRVQDCLNKKYINISKIFEIWPILKTDIGSQLIEQDFSQKYPDAVEKITSGWDDFFIKVFSLYSKKLSESDNIYLELLACKTLDRDLHTYIQLNLLSSLIAPKSSKVCIDKKKRNFWKPSISESREGYLINVKNVLDINKAVSEKRDKMAGMNLTVQPFIITVGEVLKSVEEVYIQVDDYRYKVPSVLKGIELLFKIFITFNMSYPLECEHLWYLIQWYLCGIRTNFDTQIPYICTIVNRLEKSRNE